MNESRFGINGNSQIQEHTEIQESPQMFINSLCRNINNLVDVLSIFACLNVEQLLNSVRNGLTQASDLELL